MTTPETALPNPIEPEFWVRSETEIAAGLAVLRAAPLSFHPVAAGRAGPVRPDARRGPLA